MPPGVISDITRWLLSLADGFDHGGGDGLGGALAASDQMLESRVEALALADRHFENILDLFPGQAAGAAQRHGMAVHGKALVGPQAKMAEPHAVVDQRQKLINPA